VGGDVGVVFDHQDAHLDSFCRAPRKAFLDSCTRAGERPRAVPAARKQRPGRGFRARAKHCPDLPKSASPDSGTDECVELEEQVCGPDEATGESIKRPLKPMLNIRETAPPRRSQAALRRRGRGRRAIAKSITAPAMSRPLASSIPPSPGEALTSSTSRPLRERI